VLVLDTDHLSEFDAGSSSGARLKERLLAAEEAVSATIVSAEEQLRGWLAQIHRMHDDPHAQIYAYARLQRRLDFYAGWTLLQWETRAAELFGRFRHEGVRIGSMDLKIACITLVQGATLLTRNATDFARVPGLHFANWLE
jgi:tRNA(fMet)-specific endonuclease VapC